MKLNNHGQALVIFVLLLPLFLLIIGYIIELGQMYITKSKYEQTINETIKYGLRHLDDALVKDKMQKMMDANIKGAKEITISDNKISITVKDQKEGLFKSFFEKTYDINITYTGYKKDNQIIIKKN